MASSGLIELKGLSRVHKHWNVPILSCAMICRTKVSPFGNLITKNASSQKGLENLFPFEYLLPIHPITTCLCPFILFFIIFYYFFLLGSHLRLGQWKYDPDEG